MTFSPLIIWAKGLFFFEQLFLVVARTWLELKSGTSFFGPKKRGRLFNPNHVLATTGKSCSKKKGPFAQIIKGENVILGDFLG